MSYIFTSESVSEGHPDKLCDRVSDTVLDLFLKHEPEARVACETLATTNRVVLAGEVRASESKLTQIMAEIEPAVRAAVKDIGYEQKAFHHADFEFQNYLHEQSSDIAMGVDSGDNKDEGAGDQGLMFGYACDETDVLMPAAIHYSHQILKDLATVRKQDADSILGPDSKSQISLDYDDKGRPTGVHKVVLSTQHSEKATQAEILALVTPVIANVLPDGWMVTGDDLLVNPTGQFVIGGPDGDTGLTGRKIIVDTYGGAAPHGGGAFSGKIRQRLTGRPPMPAVIWQKMLSRRAWHRVAQSRLPMLLALPSRYRFMQIHMALAWLTIKSCKKRFAIAWI